MLKRKCYDIYIHGGIEEPGLIDVRVHETGQSETGIIQYCSIQTRSNVRVPNIMTIIDQLIHILE